MSADTRRRSPHVAILALAALALIAAGCSGGLPFVRSSAPAPAKAKAAAREDVKPTKASRASKPGGETKLARELRETRESMALAPAEPWWPYHMAELYAAADSLGPAEIALADALARNPSYAPALALRSSLDWRAGRHDRAIRLLEAAIARPGAFPEGVPREITDGLALHYDALGQADRAKALLAEPRKGPATGALVYFTLKGETPEVAAPLAEQAVKGDPRSAVHQNNYAITLLRAGDALRARGHFQQAVKLDPTLPGPWYNLAILEKYYFFDDSTAALHFAKYRERSTDDPDGIARFFEKQPTPALAGEGASR